MEARKIKFRALDEITMDWVYGTPVHDSDIKGRSYIAYGCTDGIDKIIVVKETIGQYTGLTDKNGKEIYEGDVIKNSRGDWGVIVWNAPFFEVTVSENQSSLYSREYFDYVEVIGNIHENPELLTQ